MNLCIDLAPLLFNTTNDNQLMRINQSIDKKKWIDFVKNKFHLNENI
jgi:hypothetical protein